MVLAELFCTFIDVESVVQETLSSGGAAIPHLLLVVSEIGEMRSWNAPMVQRKRLQHMSCSSKLHVIPKGEGSALGNSKYAPG